MRNPSSRSASASCAWSAPDAEAEITVTSGTESLTRFATSFIHQNVTDASRDLHLRVALDGRVAEATGNQTDDDALTRLVRSTLDAARLQPIDPGWPGLAPPAEAPPVDHWDDPTAEAEPAERAERVAAFVRAAEGLETAGFCSTEGIEVAFANSAGQRVAGRSTTAALDGIARTGSSDGSARAASVQLADLDGAAAGEEATRLARDAADATDLEPGAYEVVLSPACVANVLAFLGIYGFNGRAVDEGRSFARIGESQFDSAISLARRRHAPDGGGHRLRRGGDAEAPPRARERPVSRAASSTTAAPPRRSAPRRPATRSPAPARSGRCRPTSRSSPAPSRRMRSSVPSSAAFSSPTSGTPASSTHARWSSPG